MTKIINIILIIIILVIIYYCIRNNKNDISNNPQNDILYNPQNDIVDNYLNNIPINSSNNTPNNNTQNIEKFIDLNTEYINFDYNTRPIEKEFIKEQEFGAFLNTWYPNTWIDHIDKNGNPVYNKVIKKEKNIIDVPKSSFSYDFNNTKTTNISSALKPEDKGKTIKEIYDNSMVNYKNLEPKKIQISDETSDVIMQGGSNLSYFAADTWTYEDEHSINGGLIYNDVYGDDPMSNTVSVF
jgi:hypothetical protein